MKTKKLLSVILAIVMILSLSVPAFASPFDAGYGNPCVSNGIAMYNTMQEAVDEASDGDTIVLLKDCSDPQIVVSKAIIINLNNHTYANGIVAGSGFEMTENNGVYTFTAVEQSQIGGNSTTIAYTGLANEAYTVTVPAELAPGGSGTVKLEGTWQSNRVVTVGADETVTLTNDISGADEKELAITFDGIELQGDNTQALTTSKTISVANIEKALFGTWSGAFNYQVAIADVAA